MFLNIFCSITQHRSVAKKVDPADPKYFDGKIEDDDSLSADAHEYWWGRNNPLHALNHVRLVGTYHVMRHSSRVNILMIYNHYC